MIGLIVVAAGYGTLRSVRGKPVSKLLERVRGEALFLHPLRAAEIAGITESVVMVNPRYGVEIEAAVQAAIACGLIKRRPAVVVQEKRLGSADAVYRAIPTLGRLGIGRALVTYGDMPEWSSDTFCALLAADRSDHVVTMATAMRSRSLPALDRYGRIIRHSSGGIQHIVEIDDPAATPQILSTTCVNPSLWIWNLAWLNRAIPNIQPSRKVDGLGDERHMPPLIRSASREGRTIGEFALGPVRSLEARGVNTLEELRELCGAQ